MKEKKSSIISSQELEIKEPNEILWKNYVREIIGWKDYEISIIKIWYCSDCYDRAKDLATITKE